VGEFFNVGLNEEMSAIIDEWNGSLDSATLGIRPEDIYDVECLDAAIEDYETLTAWVKVVEPLGSHKEITFTGSEEVDSINQGSTFKARISTSSNLERGDQAELAFDVEMMHIFENASGTNITKQ
jgi:multiple sugar transport system ATP-binding protein